MILPLPPAPCPLFLHRLLWRSRRPLLPLARTRLRLLLELLRLRLLLGRQDVPDVGMYSRLCHGQIGLYRCHLRGSRTHRLLVHRHLIDRRALRLHRLAEALHRRAHLLTIALHDIAHLLLLRVAQVELTEREAGRESAAAAGTEWPRTAPRPGLRKERHGARRKHRDDSRRYRNFSNTIHGLLPP